MKNEVLLPEWTNGIDIFNIYPVTIHKILKGVSDLRVHDANSCKLAIDTSSYVKTILKEIISIKKKETDPHRQRINLVNEMTKELTDKVDLIQQMIVEKVSAYEKMLKIQSETAQKQGNEIYKSLDFEIDFISSNEQQIGSTAKTIVTHKTDKSFSVVNQSLIPREYMKIDEEKIKQAIKLGVTNIPGISIIETKKIILRKR